MPKVVDHQQRRAEIADALWAVIRRDGVGAASVRSVAAQAGWSPGAIRHYFTTQSELLGFATELMLSRISERVQATPREPTVPGQLRMLEPVLPLDEQSRADAEVWFALVAASRTNPGLNQIAERSHRALRELMEMVVHDLTGTTRQIDIDGLHALVDGLALHGILYPADLPTRRIRAAVKEHLTQLARGS